ALFNYAIAHPGIGYPRSLAALTEPIQEEIQEIQQIQEVEDVVILDGGDTKPQGNVSRLLDESYAADPLIKAGYRFRYLQTGTGNGDENSFGSFEITATPVEFGKTGARNYLLDGRGIHVTMENRLATQQDPAPQD